MRTKRSVAGLIVAMMTTGALGTGTVVGVDTYHDIRKPGGAQETVAVESVVTSDATADTYHDI
ncbi:MAG TPA: hypothetical protein VFB84_06390 [Micromonosporaceae bacterium]|nr:hypothetical protein [Micromonosporaceae bacterium]